MAEDVNGSRAGRQPGAFVRHTVRAWAGFGRGGEGAAMDPTGRMDPGRGAMDEAPDTRSLASAAAVRAPDGSMVRPQCPR